MKATNGANGTALFVPQSLMIMPGRSEFLLR